MTPGSVDGWRQDQERGEDEEQADSGSSEMQTRMEGTI